MILIRLAAGMSEISSLESRDVDSLSKSLPRSAETPERPTTDAPCGKPACRRRYLCHGPIVRTDRSRCSRHLHGKSRIHVQEYKDPRSLSSRMRVSLSSFSLNFEISFGPILKSHGGAEVRNAVCRGGWTPGRCYHTSDREEGRPQA
jgi:hypothetical protein